MSSHLFRFWLTFNISSMAVFRCDSVRDSKDALRDPSDASVTGIIFFSFIFNV